METATTPKEEGSRHELHGSVALAAGFVSLLLFCFLQALLLQGAHGRSSEASPVVLSLFMVLPTLAATSSLAAISPTRRWRLGLPFLGGMCLLVYFFASIIRGQLSGQGGQLLSSFLPSV